MAEWRFFPFAHTALKNLFSKPATTGYPFEPAKYPERMRGHVQIKIEDCISCGLCARSCPPGALKVDRAARTWTINRFDCVQCGNCTNVCPKKCLFMVPGYTEPGAQKVSGHSPVRRRRNRRRSRRAESRSTMRRNAYIAPCVPRNARKTPLRWIARRKAGRSMRKNVWDAVFVRRPVPKSV